MHRLTRVKAPHRTAPHHTTLLMYPFFGPYVLTISHMVYYYLWLFVAKRLSQLTIVPIFITIVQIPYATLTSSSLLPLLDSTFFVLFSKFLVFGRATLTSSSLSYLILAYRIYCFRWEWRSWSICGCPSLQNSSYPYSKLASSYCMLARF